MKKLLACSLISTVLLGGCDTTKPLPREVIVVPDVSASIDPAAERQMFAAIEEIAQQLHRGDTLTIIPITGDADAELQGRTLHYAVPPVEDRQAYDADLRKLHTQIKDDLAHLQADAIRHPGKHTDILGSIQVAMKEFSNKNTDKRLVVLSDFIQDDQQFNFRRDPRLANERSSAKLGHNVLQQLSPHPTVSVLLARLRSVEFSSLPVGRQRAIDSFWGQVMSPSEVRADGTTNLSANVLDEKR